MNRQTGANHRLKLLGRISHFAVIAGAASASLFANSPTIAQNADDSDAVAIEEVIVTARKRQESLQDIPDSVTAFTAQEIENRGVTDLGDLSGASPNFLLRESQQPGVVFFSLRGVASARFQEPAAAVVVDGVQLTSEYQIIQALNGVEQIEVLRGPQGSLYGRNAIGGAITVTTRQPSNEFEGYLRGGYGQGDDVRISASLSGPIAEDKLFISVVGSHQDFGGVLPNVTLGTKADSEKVTFGRVKLRFLPAENVTFDLRGSIEDRKGGVGYFTNIPSSDVNDVVDIISGTGGFGTRELRDLAGQLNWDFDTVLLTATVSYAEVDDDFLQDIDNGPVAFIDGTQFVDVESFSSELRLTSQGDGPLRWLVGGYFSDIDQSVSTFLQINSCFFVDPMSCPLGPVDPATQIELPFGVNANNNKTFAIFGQANYDLSDATELTLGLRYDRDKRTQNDLVMVSTQQEIFDSVQPKISLSHRFNDESMVFATISKGFRSGAFNGTDFVTRLYDAETLWNYEIGIKLDLMDRRLRFNGAAFYIDYTDRQEYVLQGGTGSQTLFNIPESRILGLEVEATALLSENITLKVNLGYLDTEITTTNLDAEAALQTVNGLDPTIGFEGNNLPNVPDFTLGAGLQAEYPLSDRLEFFGRISVTHRGSMHTSLGNVADTLESINLVDFRLALIAGNIQFAIFGENAFNEKYHVEAAMPGFGSINPIPGGFRARSRRIGGEVKFSF